MAGLITSELINPKEFWSFVLNILLDLSLKNQLEYEKSKFVFKTIDS